MNLDANVQKILIALLRRWYLIVVFALIGGLLGYIYTANFTTLTYTSSVTFLAYATDSTDELNSSSTTTTEGMRISNNSKMTYVTRMMPTYVRLLQTNEFYEQLVDDMNNSYNANYQVSSVNNTITITPIDETAIFDVTVTTANADLSYKIAKQLESTIPKVMKNKANGLVLASVEDKAIKATSHGSLGYARKCAIGMAVGIILSAAYVILRTLLDVRIKTSDELTEKYSIPVLGSIPNFEARGIQTQSTKGVDGYVKEK